MNGLVKILFFVECRCEIVGDYCRLVKRLESIKGFIFSDKNAHCRLYLSLMNEDCWSYIFPSFLDSLCIYEEIFGHLKN